MKLNKEGRDELRKQIEERLKTVPEGQRVTIKKDLLEELLFETIKYDDIVIKLPFWSGKFLSKIDLSNVDFEDVSWTALSDCSGTPLSDKLESSYYEDLATKAEYLYKELKHRFKDYDFVIDYSNTNAKIDFKKSAEAKYSSDEKTAVWEANFSGMDFSDASMDGLNFSWCDLSNTGIKISNESNLSFYYCNLENNNLNNLTFRIEEIIDYHKVYECNLKNTGIKFIYDNDKKLPAGYTVEDWGKEISNILKAGKLDGCYVDGKLIHSKEERQQIAEQKRQEYKDYINDLAASAITNSDGENNRFHK